jgi:acyl dehydratase
MKRADEVGIGEEFGTYEFRVTPEFNRQYLQAQEDYNPIYLEHTEFGPPIVHPGLLINHSNVTRSPSFYLPTGVAAIHAKEEVEFIGLARVGRKLRVNWKVVDFYVKRGRPYQVKAATITDEDGIEILNRKITDTYISVSK